MQTRPAGRVCCSQWGALWRQGLFLLLVSCALRAGAADSASLFRCQTEEDVDGVNCRIDMLPTEALQQMLVDRGFETDSYLRDELELIILEVLSYEAEEGIDLRAEFAGARAPESSDETAGETAGSETAETAGPESEEAAGIPRDEEFPRDKEFTIRGHFEEFFAEFAAQVKRDANALVSLLPAPVANQVRGGASFVVRVSRRALGPAVSAAASQAGRALKGARKVAGKVKQKAQPAIDRALAPHQDTIRRWKASLREVMSGCGLAQEPAQEKEREGAVETADETAGTSLDADEVSMDPEAAAAAQEHGLGGALGASEDEEEAAASHASADARSNENLEREADLAGQQGQSGGQQRASESYGSYGESLQDEEDDGGEVVFL